MSVNYYKTPLVIKNSCPQSATRWQHSGQSFPVVVEQWSRDSIQCDPPQGDIDPFNGVVCPCQRSFQPWTGHGGLCKFYKVDSLAVATRISHNYQVLLAWWDIRISNPTCTTIDYPTCVIALENSIISCKPTGAGIFDNTGWKDCSKKRYLDHNQNNMFTYM